MNHLFVPYQESLGLQDIGFDEACFAIYPKYQNDVIENYSIFGTYLKQNLANSSILKPLYQQAFDWFREKHGYNWNKEIPEYEGFCIYIGSKNPKVKLKCNDHFISNFYQDYREAELIVLQTLIQIVKNDNTTRS